MLNICRKCGSPENYRFWSSHCGSQEVKNPTSIHEEVDSIPGLAQWIKGSGIGHRCSLDPAWLWLWCGPTAAAPIRPLAWELPYAAGEGLKRKNKKNRR